MRNLEFDSFKWITFDCYGTLIDWEAGIRAALKPVLARRGIAWSSRPVLSLYGELEAELESGAYVPYREVLSGVVAGLGEKLGFRPTSEETRALSESLPHWAPFQDTVPALKALKQKYKLGIISNVDNELFAATEKTLEVTFDLVVTAEEARSYKPSHNNFLIALHRIGTAKREMLHVAQSIYHDVIPTSALGIANVWVNRGSSNDYAGATKAAVGTPDLEVPDLRRLAALACQQPL
jgi:2-haloacid dehalogenase